MKKSIILLFFCILSVYAAAGVTNYSELANSLAKKSDEVLLRNSICSSANECIRRELVMVGGGEKIVLHFDDSYSYSPRVISELISVSLEGVKNYSGGIILKFYKDSKKNRLKFGFDFGGEPFLIVDFKEK